jgi:hypothetical protein
MVQNKEITLISVEDLNRKLSSWADVMYCNFCASMDDCNKYLYPKLGQLGLEIEILGGGFVGVGITVYINKIILDKNKKGSYSTKEVGNFSDKSMPESFCRALNEAIEVGK